MKLEEALESELVRRADRGLGGLLDFWRWVFADLVRGWTDRSEDRSAGGEREMRGWTIIDLQAWSRNARYGLRSLARSPVFLVAAVLTLGLGIGSTVGVYALVERALWRPLPYPAPEELYMITPSSGSDGLSYPNYFDLAVQPVWRAAAYRYSRVVATYDTGEWAEELVGVEATASLSDVLGILPALGRWWENTEDRPGAAPVAVISHAVRQELIGLDREPLGTFLDLNGVGHEVVGVMPEGFRFPDREVDYWTPLRIEPSGDPRRRIHGDLSMIVRTRGGGTRSSRRALATKTAELVQAFPTANARLSLSLVPRKDFVSGTASSRLLLLSGAVALLLLVVCTNVAALFGSRLMRARDEQRIRQALGASPWDIVRRATIEAIIVATLGGTLGVVLTTRLLPLVASAATWIPAAQDVVVDRRLLAFSASVVLLVALCVGVVPSLLNARGSAWTASRWGAAGPAMGSRSHGALVLVQVGTAFSLLVSALLLTSSFRELSTINPGFRTADVTSFRVRLPRSRYRFSEPRLAFFSTLRARLRSLPGVSSVGLTSQVFARAEEMGRTFTIENRDAKPGEESAATSIGVGIGYFETVGIELIRGRTFTEGDRPESTPVAVVNEAMAERFWPEEDPVGRRIKTGPAESRDPWLEVIGVVRNTRRRGLTAAPIPEFFLPYEQDVEFRSRTMFLLVATEPGVEVRAADLRRSVARVDPGVAVTQLATFEDLLAGTLSSSRFVAAALTGFAIAALGLTLLGLYGLLSILVQDRTREIGIRQALGGGPRVGVRVLAEAGKLIGAGIVLGLIGVSLIGGVLRNHLYDLSPTDPISVALAALAFVAVGLVGASIPTWRAIRVDPAEAMRAD